MIIRRTASSHAFTDLLPEQVTEVGNRLAIPRIVSFDYRCPEDSGVHVDPQKLIVGTEKLLNSVINFNSQCIYVDDITVTAQIGYEK